MNYEIKQRFLRCQCFLYIFPIRPGSVESSVDWNSELNNSIYPQFPSSIIKHREQFKTGLGIKSQLRNFLQKQKGKKGKSFLPFGKRGGLLLLFALHLWHHSTWKSKREGGEEAALFVCFLQLQKNVFCYLILQLQLSSKSDYIMVYLDKDIKAHKKAHCLFHQPRKVANMMWRFHKGIMPVKLKHRSVP